MLVRIEEPSQELPSSFPLLELLADARLVALGESGHGTREIFELKHSLIRLLVQQSGFRSVIFEEGIAEAAQIDEILRRGPAPTPASLSRLVPIWQTNEILSLFTWMSESIRQGVPLSFAGIDVQHPDVALEMVDRDLSDIDPQLAAEVARLYSPLKSLSAAGWRPQTGAVYEAAIDGTRQVRDLLHAKLGEEEPRAPLVIDLARMLEVASTLRPLFDPRDPEKMNLFSQTRDEEMATNVLRILDRGGKVILWAHNSHLARKATSSWLMGPTLARELGSDYRVVGMTFQEGSYRAYDPDVDRFTECTAVPSPPNSVESHLGGMGAETFLAPVEDLGGWAKERRAMRDIGYRKEDQQFSDHLPVADMFDAIGFIRVGTAAGGLPENH